jgi:hypothetical protein
MAVKSPRVALVVDAVADLPSVAVVGDLALVLTDSTLRSYSGSAWAAISTGSGASISAATPVVIASGTVGSAAVDTVRLGSVDRSAGNTILALATEGTGAVVTGTPASATGAVVISVNGTVYYLTASTSAPT